MKLRNALIKLSYENPELRKDLLPLLKEARELSMKDFLDLKITNPDTGNKVKMVTLKSKPKDSRGYKEYQRALEKLRKKNEKEAPNKVQKSDTPNPLFTKEELSLTPIPSQKTKDPEEIFKQAKVSHEMQLDWLNRGSGLDKIIGAEVVRIDNLVKEKGDIAGSIDKAMKTPKPVIIIGPPKELERSREKVKTNFDGDWTKLTDVVRASVVVDTYKEMENLVKEMKASGMKLACAPLDRFAQPTEAGYRDLKLSVEFENGHVGEIQLHVKPIMEVKEQAHKMYEIVRTIQAKAKEENRTELTEEEQNTLDKANKTMKELYDDAWSRANESPKNKAASAKEAAARKYYMLNGVPGYWEIRKFPVLDHPSKEEVYYDLEDFFHNAAPISKTQYDSLKKENEMEKKSSVKGSMRNELIKLAYNNPELREDLLPLILKK